MVLRWFDSGTYGTYNIPPGDEPDYPIQTAEGEGGNYQRSYGGVFYNPTSYIYKTYTFSFTGITAPTIDAFVNVFIDKHSFSLFDDDLGTLNIIPVPGSLNTEYITLGNCNLSFRVEQGIGV